LATQSADNTLKIWRCETWECERTIKGFFGNNSTSSLFTRLDWSADGAFLIAACASNAGFQTAKVIIRKGFNYERDFVGFKNSVSCVRSSNACVSYQNSKDVKMELNLIAVGSLDRSLSVWLLPSINRPLCVIRNFFPEGLLDLAWYKSTLVAIGINGAVRCVFFEEEEIGKHLDGPQMCNHFDTLYGNIPTSFKSYLPRLNVDGGASWIDQVMKGVFVPSDRLSAKCSENHRRLGYHTLTPTCDDCCNFYLRTMEEFDIDESVLKNIAEDLHSKFRRLTVQEKEEQEKSFTEDLSDSIGPLI